jgi:hypothetical protein
MWTEERWLAERNPGVLFMQLPSLDTLRRTKAGRRKCRLFGCACCRRVSHLGFSDDCAKLIDLAEQLAEGLVTAKAVEPLLARIPREGQYGVGPCLTSAARSVASSDIEAAAIRTAIVTSDAVAYAQRPPSTDEHVRIAFKEREQQEGLFRCIFGNPFRPVALDPAWLTSTVVDLARGIYDERAFDRMPILADALQDAGCDNDDALNHCRGPGPHARGCWVVDLILGKS